MHLVIENLSKTYPGGVQALKDVSLMIEPLIFGLLGPNVAGPYNKLIDRAPSDNVEDVPRGP